HPQPAQFLFLGTGTSGGIPIIACGCDTCTSDDPRDNRTRSGAAVRWTDPMGKDRLVLIDTTPDLRQQALRHRLNRCDAILYTHNHVDHTFGLDEVRRFNAVMNAPIDIYADAHTMGFLRNTFRHIFDRNANINNSFVASLIPNMIVPERAISLHGLRFTPIPLLHGKQPVLGFRIESDTGADMGGAFPIAYCTDVSAVPTDSWRLLEGLSTLVLDGLRFRHHPTHLTIDQAVGIAERVGARQTWLTHIAHEVRHSVVDDELPAGINLAYDGLALG
ncbi:MAG: MBL fold metallo-hydrolase, partial [Phycisphaerales bacterium]|nr:MBL fold metallo-hydrolase [Phycisphaerales bacterium]